MARHVDVLAPCKGIAGQRATQGIDIVKGTDDVLGHPQGLELRQVGIHLCRCLSPRGILHHHLDAIDLDGFQVSGNLPGRGDKTDNPLGNPLADGGVDLSGRSFGESIAILVGGSPGHSVASQNVLLDGIFGEAARSNDLDLTAINLLLAHHATDAAKMISMGMAVDHRFDRIITQLLFDQFKSRPSGFGHRQHVEDDPAGLALDEGHIGQVVTAHLVDAVGHLIETVLHVQGRLALQAGMDTVVILALLQKIIAAELPDHVTFAVFDFEPLRPLEQALVGQGKIPGVSKRQCRPKLPLKHLGVLGCRLRCRNRWHDTDGQKQAE